MSEKFYTIDQVAQILEVHHKTIRNFINDGKLKANKIGKQWRISKEDLDSFMDMRKDNKSNTDNNTPKNCEVEFSTSEINIRNKYSKINVSTVVEINDVGNTEYSRLSNMLLAFMNTSDYKDNNSTINLKYTQDENKLRVMLWGDIKFIENMLGTIAILTEEN